MKWFARHIRNHEVCFCQNVIDIWGELVPYTTDVTLREVTDRVLNERGLYDLFYKNINEISGNIVEDCYPYDRGILLNYAEALFDIATSVVDWINPSSDTRVYLVLSRITRKMKLSYDEKKYLIVKYLLQRDTTIADFIVNEIISTY